VLPEAARIVTEYVPDAVPDAVLIVKVLVGFALPEGVTDAGLRLQVTPLTAEEQVSATPLLNPFRAATVTVDVAEFPGATVPGAAAVAEI
jgi:hypothetical protein